MRLARVVVAIMASGEHRLADAVSGAVNVPDSASVWAKVLPPVVAALIAGGASYAGGHAGGETDTSEIRALRAEVRQTLALVQVVSARVDQLDRLVSGRKAGE